MPYIIADRRGRALTEPQNMGELTFAIQQLLKGYVHRHGNNFQTYGECVGALGSAQLDLWDRRMAAYEHSKCDTNGDVW